MTTPTFDIVSWHSEVTTHLTLRRDRIWRCIVTSEGHDAMSNVCVVIWTKSLIMSPFQWHRIAWLNENHFSEKSDGGFSFYNVLAFWPDLTQPFVLQKVAQRMRHKLFNITARSAPGVQRPFQKKLMGRCITLSTGEVLVKVSSNSKKV